MDQVTTISPALHFTVNKMAGDMNFVGMFYIIIGALECLTIIGAIVGIPLIISGLRLRESSDSFRMYLNAGDSSMLERALERESRFFYIQKIFIIISIALFVLYISLLYCLRVDNARKFSEFQNGLVLYIFPPGSETRETGARRISAGLMKIK